MLTEMRLFKRREADNDTFDVTAEQFAVEDGVDGLEKGLVVELGVEGPGAATGQELQQFQQHFLTAYVSF